MKGGCRATQGPRRAPARDRLPGPPQAQAWIDAPAPAQNAGASTSTTPCPSTATRARRAARRGGRPPLQRLPRRQRVPSLQPTTAPRAPAVFTAEARGAPDRPYSTRAARKGPRVRGATDTETSILRVTTKCNLRSKIR